MLEEAEAAFRSFAVHQKSDSKPKRSAKTANLIKSFSVANSSPSDQPGQQRAPKKEATPGNKQASGRPVLKNSQSFDEEVIVAESEQGVCSMPEAVETKPEDVERESENTKTQDAHVINAGLVRQRANVFANSTPPAAGPADKTANANVKKWIAANHPVTSPPVTSPRGSDAGHDRERLAVVERISNMEHKVEDLNAQMEVLGKDEDAEEGALEIEEELHACRLELTKLKRKLAKMQKESQEARTPTRQSSSSSESHSVAEDGMFDRASSTGSRTPRGGSVKANRELKPQPPVNANAFNDDGEVVPEGNVISQIQVFSAFQLNRFLTQSPA